LNPEGVANEIQSRLASPSPDLHDRVLRAARQAMATKEMEPEDIPWKFPVFRLAACLVMAVLLIFAGNLAGDLATAQWQYSSPPLDRSDPEIDFLAGLADSPILAKLIAVEAARPERVSLQDFKNHQRKRGKQDDRGATIFSSNCPASSTAAKSKRIGRLLS
jgi:hypothetical protein